MFRSGLEAAVAEDLTRMNLGWFYEPTWAKLQSGGSHVPDFYLPAPAGWLGCWLEVRGYRERDLVDEHAFAAMAARQGECYVFLAVPPGKRDWALGPAGPGRPWLVRWACGAWWLGSEPAADQGLACACPAGTGCARELEGTVMMSRGRLVVWPENAGLLRLSVAGLAEDTGGEL